MNGTPVAGYLHPGYVAALAEQGAPRALPQSGGWVLARAIPGSDRHDAVGCYPLFTCRRWDLLAGDVAELAGDLVSLALVTDPFGDYDAALLARCFPDHCVAYKEHFVTDLRQADGIVVARHHQRNLRRARLAVEVEVCPRPAEHLDAWVALYATLSRRHGIRGAAAFSRASFAEQLAVPGVVALRALHGGATVGMTLWYEHGEVAYYHLGAYSDVGYAHGAAFAIFATALDHFRGRVAWLALGAGAGVTGNDEDGLTRFKRGWATGTRTAYFCGRVLDRVAYDALVASRVAAAGSPNYFPAYRAPAPAPDVAALAGAVRP